MSLRLHWFITLLYTYENWWIQVCKILQARLPASPQTQPAFPFLLRQWGNFHSTSMCACISFMLVCVCSCGSCSWWAPDGYAGRQLLPFGFDMWASSQPAPGHCTTPFLLIHPPLSSPLPMNHVQDLFLPQIQWLSVFFSSLSGQFSLIQTQSSVSFLRLNANEIHREVGNN